MSALCPVCSAAGCDCMRPRTRTPADVEREAHAYRVRMAAEWKGSLEDPYDYGERLCEHCQQPYPARSTRQRHCGQICSSDALSIKRRIARRRAA